MVLIILVYTALTNDLLVPSGLFDKVGEPARKLFRALAGGIDVRNADSPVGLRE